MPDTTTHQGDTVLTYELYQMRSAELRRQADQERLVRTALIGRRAARKGAHTAQEAPEPEAHTPGPRRRRFTHAA
ncbi:hypothetical protein [Streptomyces sp. NPDC004065]|uniref:hypothetical protein n=1 Tax=Streptomyces sp. NPDC004065 TaxID=3364689 RepID=UPI00384DA929